VFAGKALGLRQTITSQHRPTSGSSLAEALAESDLFAALDFASVNALRQSTIKYLVRRGGLGHTRTLRPDLPVGSGAGQSATRSFPVRVESEFAINFERIAPLNSERHADVWNSSVLASLAWGRHFRCHNAAIVAGHCVSDKNIA
jgi:hypothetical protein